MKKLNNDEIRDAVRSYYGKTAEGCCGGPAPQDSDACCVDDAEAKASGASGCGCGTSTADNESQALQGACCSGSPQSADDTSHALGYSVDDLASLPEGANLGQSCGNPKHYKLQLLRCSL